MTETVEQFLARGGKIQKLKHGETGLDVESGIEKSKKSLFIKSALSGAKRGGCHPRLKK